jgi:uncharacterized spore protein YtfJ
VIDTIGGAAVDPRAAQDLGEEVIEKIFAATQPGTVFSAPVVSAPYTIITASEVVAAGGFGFGSGSAPTSATNGTAANDQPRQVAASGGGGGGGGSAGRPVAAIIIGPDGVKIEPIVDPTKIALAAIGAWLSIALLLLRRARAPKVGSSLR